MAQRYWETTYTFSAQADVPFQYVCGNCGKTVSGIRTTSMTYPYRKTAAFDRSASDNGKGLLALTVQERKSGDEKARDLLQKELALYKASAEKGNYDFLKDHVQCPYCRQTQKWAYPAKKSRIEVCVGILLSLLGAVSLYLFFAFGAFISSLDFAGEGTGTLLLIVGCGCVMIGLYAVITGFDELRKRKSLNDQKQQRPSIRFPV